MSYEQRDEQEGLIILIVEYTDVDNAVNDFL
jgi:hypothetical protein